MEEAVKRRYAGLSVVGPRADEPVDWEARAKAVEAELAKAYEQMARLAEAVAPDGNLREMTLHEFRARIASVRPPVLVTLDGKPHFIVTSPP